ncbi:MAG: DUF4175 family protein [Emcibacter sp.]|nr:DUF4175 family protein [Emcibacter sp.]
MDGIKDKPISKKAALYSGLFQAVALYLVYLALSLTDLWGRVPAVIQAVSYGFLALSMMFCIMKGLMAAPMLSGKTTIKTVILSLLLVTMAAILAGPDSKRLLEIAVKPRAIFSYPTPEIIMTVTPPKYSGQRTFTERLNLQTDLPEQDENSPILNLVPEGSEIIIQIKNLAYAPTLIAGDQRINFLSTIDGGFAAKFILQDESRWQIQTGTRQIGSWPILILEDDAPVFHRADFQRIMTQDGLFSLSLDLSDDYELDQVTVGLVPSGARRDMIYDQTRLAISGLKTYSDVLYINLANSDFAGQDVDLILEAIDQTGQKTTKVITGISLPAREFSNPISRQLIQIRDGVRTQPKNRKKLVRELMALGLTPDKGQIPPIYYIALRAAYWRLNNPSTDTDITSARDILWDLANELEDGPHQQFNSEILTLLASLKLALYQQQPFPEIKKQLQKIDHTIVLFQRRTRTAPVYKNYRDDEDYNVKELRKLYSEILSQVSYQEDKTGCDLACDLVSFLEHGVIYRDRGILSGPGYARFQTIRKAQDQVKELEKTQRRVMSFVYKNSVPLELVSLTLKNTPVKQSHKNTQNRKNIQNWVEIQQKLAVTVDQLGQMLLKNGIDTSTLTGATRDLIQDAASSMKAGDMAAASGYQSQVMTLLKNLKHTLKRENRYNPIKHDTPSP